MIKNTLRYLIHLPTVIQKLNVLHRYSVFFDEATPEQLEKSLQAWHLIKREYGFLKSLQENQCLDAHGQPIPWYSYPAIEQLSRWDFSDCDVLEYGCGNSTKWWAARAKSVTSIENQPAWFDKIQQNKPDNCALILAEVNDAAPEPEQIQNYIDKIDDLADFDVIIVDGVNHRGVRKKCVEKAIEHLRPGGLIIVDNADWLPATCRYLRENDFFEIDFTGLGPLNTYPETTSIFFNSGFRIKPASAIHPGYATGGLKFDSDLAEDT